MAAFLLKLLEIIRSSVLLLALLMVASCTKSGGSSKGGDESQLASDNPTETQSDGSSEGEGSSPGGTDSPNGLTDPIESIGAPSGTDALSATTNHSSKPADTTPELNPYLGAAFIAPPNINNYGSVSLTYPVETLPGRTAMQPSINLSYSSSGGDGLCGVGWNLATGLGVISRTTRYGALHYDQRDEFSYNGKRLVKVSGEPNSENGIYRLEIESGFMRFELQSIESGGVWKVYDKAGVVTSYGLDQSSRIYHPEDSTLTYIWNFSRSIDLNGNYMEAAYDYSSYNDDHLSYLKTIRYTGNETTGAKARQFVSFSYKKRDEAYLSKASGFVMRMDRLLSNIEIGYDNKVLWSYEPLYENSEDSSRPLLVSVVSDRNTTRPEFYYKEASHSFLWAKAANQLGGALSTHDKEVRRFEGDFNGDGRSDMVLYNPTDGTWKALEADREGGYLYKVYAEDDRFAGLTDSKASFFKCNVTGDYNGDGKSDIAFFEHDTKLFWIAAHNGKSFTFLNYGKLDIDVDLFSCEWFPGDFDANGLSDALLFDEPSGKWILMKNEGSSFSFQIIGRSFQHIYREDFEADTSLNSESSIDVSSSGLNRHMVRFFSGDYNGDGSSDIGLYDERSASWYVGVINTEQSGKLGLTWRLMQTFDGGDSLLFANENFSGDYNGDGYSDFLFFDRSKGEWIVGLTKDESISFQCYGYTPEFKDITRWLQGDFNGDGRTDVGFYSSTDHKIWIGEATPKGFRYRIYSNVAYGGPAQEVLTPPLPEESAKQVTGYGLSATGEALCYTSNSNPLRGVEKVFAGTYAGEAGLLIYNERTKAFAHADKSGRVSEESLGISGSLFFPLNHSVYYKGESALLAIAKSSDSSGTVTTTIYYVYHNGVSITAESAGSFTSEELAFDSAYSLFTHADVEGSQGVLLLDDEASTPAFYFYSNALSVPGYYEISDASDISADELRYAARSGFTRLVVNALGEAYLIDTRAESIVYKLSFVNGLATLSKTECSDSINLLEAKDLYPAEEGFVVASHNGSNWSFAHYKVDADETVCVGTYMLEASDYYAASATRKGELLILRDGASYLVDLDGSDVETALDTQILEREDLQVDSYDYEWLQGDYNGDGKTDVGIFSHVDPSLYLALTSGTVPDLICEVDNGIGGSYHFSYENSSSFDNSGDDDIPDLPVNYKVCTKLIIDDGLGRTITTRYRYSDGFAFSAFINGKKETDYFGFSHFTKIDAYGLQQKSEYYTTPYEDYRKNRALAGALKQSRLVGSDGIEYESSVHEYSLHEIIPEGFSEAASYIVVPSKVDSYKLATKVMSKRVVMDVGDDYTLQSQITTSTDCYSDSSYSQVSTSDATYFENVAQTNVTRPYKSIHLQGSSYETTTRYSYDVKSKLIETHMSYSGTGREEPLPLIKKYEYNSFGQQTKRTDASALIPRITETLYDDEFHIFIKEKRSYSSDEDYLSEKYSYDYATAFGQLTVKTDVNNNKSYFEYDEYGRLAKQCADLKDKKRQFSSYNYDTSFPLSGRVRQFTGTDDPDKEYAAYVDGMGRVIHSIRSASDGAAVKSGALGYDAAGRLVRKSQVEWSDRSEFDHYVPHSSEKHPTTFEYDAAGRLVKTTLPLAEGESLAYYTKVEYVNAWQTVHSDSLGRSKTTLVNGRALVLKVSEGGVNEDGTILRASIGFAYDEAGRRIKKMDLHDTAMSPTINAELFTKAAKDTSGNNVCQWNYDGFGRIVESYDADLGYSKISYTAFGEVESKTDARSLTTRYEYDRLGRITRELLAEDEGEIVYAYDTAPNGKGQVATITSPVMTKSFIYDELGRTVKDTRTIEGEERNFVTEYGFDLLGRQKKIVYPKENGEESFAAVYAYSEDGVKSVWVDQGEKRESIIEGISYNEFGQKIIEQRGNNTKTEYSYDIRGRLKTLKTLTQNNGYDYAIQNVVYDFNADNTIAGIENKPELGFSGLHNGSLSYSYSYDGLGRLTGSNGRLSVNQKEAEYFSRTYSYSLNGNLTSKSMIDRGSKNSSDKWFYSYSNHAVTSVSANNGSIFAMSYDACGNMITQGDTHRELMKNMHYDSKNRIDSVTDEKGKELGKYEYDEQGFRVRKRSVQKDHKGGEYSVEVLHPTMYLGIEQKLSEDGTKIERSKAEVYHIYLDGVRIACIDNSNGKRFYYTDQVDSVKVICDGDGMPVKSFEYLPYGETWFENGKVADRAQFNGQCKDEETGFYFYNARHYDSALGRFVTADTVVDGEYSAAGWNRYMYCAGNPVLYKDPTGHFLELMQAILFTPQDIGQENLSAVENFQQDYQLVDRISKNEATVKDIETYMQQKNGGHKVDLSKGFNVVVLKNFYENDTTLSRTQIKGGGYTTRGSNAEDKFKDMMYVIDNNEIKYRDYATAAPSRAPGIHRSGDFYHNKNAGNALKPGEYIIGHGGYSKSLGRYLQIYSSENKYDGWDTSVPSTGGYKRHIDGQKTLERSQGGLWIHMATGEGGAYSGSTGCTVSPGFNRWSKKNYNIGSWQSKKGKYYLVNTAYSGPADHDWGYTTIEERTGE